MAEDNAKDQVTATLSSNDKNIAKHKNESKDMGNVMINDYANNAINTKETSNVKVNRNALLKLVEW